MKRQRTMGSESSEKDKKSEKSVSVAAEEPKMKSVKLHLKAENLRDEDWGKNNKSDPFFSVIFNDQVLFKSPVIEDNLNPEWEEAEFDIPEAAVGNLLKVRIADDDTCSDDKLAEIEIAYPFRKEEYLVDEKNQTKVFVLNNHGSLFAAKKSGGGCFSCFGGKKKEEEKEE